VFFRGRRSGDRVRSFGDDDDDDTDDDGWMTTGATVFFKLTPLVGWCACARASEHTRARCVRGAVSDVLTRSHSLRTGLDARTRRRVDP